MGFGKRTDNRPDPIALMEESNKGRIPKLIPIRHGRMLGSPFTCYRGAALNMAADLAGTPTSGLRVQACGDAHLLNFGAYATPERRVIFDINDLDETLPGPWEWDMKRLAASFVLACRDNGFSEDGARDAALSCVRSYREHMAEYSKMRRWTCGMTSIDVEKILTIDSGRRSPRADARNAWQKPASEASWNMSFPELACTPPASPRRSGRILR